MTNEDGKRFQAAMSRLLLIFPDRAKVNPEGQIKADVINLYWSALKPYSIEQVEGAMQHVQNTQTESFFPVPGKVVDAIKTHFPNKPWSSVPDVGPVTPDNPAGAAYMLYCLNKEKDWDWAEYPKFKLDFLAGRVKIVRSSERGGDGLFGTTVVTWNKGE